jgi:plasmid rolling circle replication initiator protein Rep
MNMGSKPDKPTPVYLSEIIPSEKPWDKHRRLSMQVQKHYSGSDFDRYAQRIEQCSKELAFVFEAQDSGEMKARLRQARFCRVRHCAVCQWRKSLAWKARFFNAAPKLLEAFPKSRYVFLTLTVRNMPVTELRAAIQEMNKGWDRLTKRKGFPAQGFVKSLEVTRQADNGYAHPHFHVLMQVPPSYFTHGYIPKAEWVQLWRSCMKLDYDPSVHVQKVRERKGDKNPLSRGVLECLKYSVKGDDLVQDRDWLIELTTQMHKLRTVSVGGTFRDFIKEDEPEDLINVDEEKVDENLDVDDFLIWVKFNGFLGRFVVRD